MTTFGEKLRSFRKEKQMTLRELADRIRDQTGGHPRIDFAYISRLENGNVRPAEETIVVLSKGLGLSAEQEDELLSLARRVPPDIANIFEKKKSLPALLRTAAPLKEEQIRNLIKEAKKMGEKK